jgi:hypothetical protein
MILEAVRRAHIPSTWTFRPDALSGIGNIVMQVAAQTGCKSMGIEIRPELDDITNSCYAYLNEEARQMGKVVGPCNFIIVRLFFCS